MGIMILIHFVIIGMTTPFNQSTEVSTIIMYANATGLSSMLATPTSDSIKDIEVYNLTYISSNEKYFFEGAGFQNSGKSTKDFAKQSYKFSFNEFQNKTTDTRKYTLSASAKLCEKMFNFTIYLLTHLSTVWGRKDFKLRADETDPTLMYVRNHMTCLLLTISMAKITLPLFIYIRRSMGLYYFFRSILLFCLQND
jgi:hypothetical protein